MIQPKATARHISLLHLTEKELRDRLDSQCAPKAFVDQLFNLHTRKFSPNPVAHLSPERVKNVMVALFCGQYLHVGDMIGTGTMGVFAAMMHITNYPWYWIREEFIRDSRGCVFEILETEKVVNNKEFGNLGLLVLPRGSLITQTGSIDLLGFFVTSSEIEIPSIKNAVSFFEFKQAECDYRIFWFGIELNGAKGKDYHYGGTVDLDLSGGGDLVVIPSYNDFMLSKIGEGSPSRDANDSAKCVSLIMDVLLKGSKTGSKGLGQMSPVFIN